MANETLVALIDSEIAKLTQVRSLLANTGKISAKLIERTAKKIKADAAKAAKSAKVAAPAKAAPKTRKKRRTLSPEARQRIADAQKKRWAATKGK
jgi:CRP-like cAMP-binding protein